MIQAWDLIDIVDCLYCCKVGIEALDMIQHIFGRRYDVQGEIEEEGVHVEVCDLGSKGYLP